jgi:hypothetical protein
MMVQGKGITAKWGAGFCFRAVHQRGMAATGRDVGGILESVGFKRRRWAMASALNKE